MQAYQKRAGAVIDWIADMAAALDRRLMVRLVKGAYWDSEIKRAQERGLADYPVFSRKAMTDLCYLDCARRLLEARPRLYPQFATHNALTVASVIEDAGGVEDLRIPAPARHGRGALSRAAGGIARADLPRLCAGRRLCRSARLSGAPAVGERRQFLLRVGGGRSVGADRDRAAAAAALDRRRRQARHPHIPLPRDLFAPERRNSTGVEFGDSPRLTRCWRKSAPRHQVRSAAPLIDGVAIAGRARSVRFADRRESIGSVQEGDEAIVAAAMAAAQAGFPPWSATPVAERAAALERAGDLIERHRGRLIALLQSEAGKTLDDCVSEVREAADYCRYYASASAPHFGAAAVAGPDRREQRAALPRPRRLRLHQPVEFSAGDFHRPGGGGARRRQCVVAKPAEQTPLIATEAVKLLHEAGVPASALHLVPGDGKVGGLLTGHAGVAGVVFTGSTEVARLINRTLAAKDGPIPVLIAETGGINAMIVDATALPEQVTDDVIASAFRSAGQRCSALRLLCVQDDVAERVLDMVMGAARELTLGDPRDLATQVGPVIDAEAQRQARALDRGHARRAALPLGGSGAVARHLCRAGDHRTRSRRRTERRSVRASPACCSLANGRDRPIARRPRRQRHRAHARHPFAHRCHRRAHRRAAAAMAMSTSTAT